LPTIDNLEATAGRTAQAVRLFQDRVEYRGEIAGRGIDDLQYLGGRGLLLQGFAQGFIRCFARADVADCADQSHRSPGSVADRDAAVFDPTILTIAVTDPVFAIEPCRDAFEAIAQRCPVF